LLLFLLLQINLNCYFSYASTLDSESGLGEADPAVKFTKFDTSLSTCSGRKKRFKCCYMSRSTLLVGGWFGKVLSDPGGVDN